MTFLLLLAALCGPSAPTEYAYLWDSDKRVVQIVVERCKVGEVSTNTLKVKDSQGRELLRIDGEQFILGEPLRIPLPSGDGSSEETLFLTEWSAGMTFRLIPLRVSGESVVRLADIQSDGREFALLDMDGDGFPEICIWRHHSLNDPLPVALDPFDLVAYRWSGKALVPKRRIRQVDITEWLWRRH